MNIGTEIIEMALGFIESGEMRECLRNTLFTGNDTANILRYCRDIIVGSRAGIGEKMSALRQLPPHKEVIALINAAESALSERENVTGDVFLVTLHYPYEEPGKIDTWGEREPCLTFEKVLDFISRETTRECEWNKETIEQCMERVWYEVEKFIPDKNGELQHKITWVMNAKGEIMFFELGDGYKKQSSYSDDEDSDDDFGSWGDWEDGSSNWTYPPVPFDFGDIITIDMRPFYNNFHGVITRIGDNCDCCAVWCIYAGENRFLRCEALKHNMHGVLSKISPLYRAERFDGELPEYEKMLKIISEAIKREPSTDEVSADGILFRTHALAEQFEDFVHKKYIRRKTSRGCSWSEFKKQFSEVLAIEK